MIELRRILLVDWYLFRVEQINFAGFTALIGPNGSGKSAVIDAAQTVLTGANMLSIRFNPSAQSVSRSKRSIRDYCLGVVSLDEKGERSEPTRLTAYTYVVLGFVDPETDETINLGVAFSASAARSEERCEARFMVKGGLIGQDDMLELVGDDEVETRHWHAVRTLLRARNLEVTDDFASARDFVAEGLRALSPPGFPLDPQRFLKAFRNALLLKPVDNPTDFVRNYVLDVPTIHVDRLRRSIELYRYLSNKIGKLKAETASLTQIQRIVARAAENERTIRLLEWQTARIRWEQFRRRARELQGELDSFRKEAAAKRVDAVTAQARLSRIEADCAHIELTLKLSDGEQLALIYEADRSRAVAERENVSAPLKVVEALVRCIENLTERRVIAGRDDVLHGLLSSVALAHKPVRLGRWTNTLEEGWRDASNHLDAALQAVTTERLADVQKIAGASLFAAQKEVHDIQERIDQIGRNLSRLDSGLNPIEPGTSALMDALEAVGIRSQPLCDLVDAKDPKWRVAAEAALGRAREALIVEPENAVRALEIYRRGSEEQFAFAQVVNTTKTAQTRPADKGTLATVIKTENRHARAFVDFRMGRLVMVDSMDRIVAGESAITPDRMMLSGRTIKRLAHPGYLKLGRGFTEETRRLLNEEKAELLGRLAEKARTAQRLKDDSSLIEGVVRGFEEMRSQSIVCERIGETLSAFDAKIVDLESSANDARRSRDPELVKKQERLNVDRTTAQKDKNTADEAWQKAQNAENRVGWDYEKLLGDHDPLQAERRARAATMTRDPLARPEPAKFEALVRKMVADALASLIESNGIELGRRKGDTSQRLARELTSGLLRHCQSFQVTVPFSEQDAQPEMVGPWAEAEIQRLEKHELVQYEEQCRNAASEMTTAFRDDLLHRLHDAFEGIKETLAELNRHLKDRLFHGRDYYEFKSSQEPTHADMIELVRESRKPEFKLPLFSAQTDDKEDTAEFRAIRHIEKLLDDKEAKTDEIEDPRKYFNFELYIHDAEGRVRSSLTSRAGTGSGGEGQLPFYIAIGASLAATYQNRRTGRTGLALAIFDEAFNRLDTKAICACSDFMKSLGLQIVVATPDEKRHIFMEVADSIVNVNRSGNVVMIDTEYPKEKTRSALAEIDPYRKGFDEFKAEMIVAGTSPKVPAERREAAE